MIKLIWLMVSLMSCASDAQKLPETYGSFPNPRLPFDTTSYPNQQYSELARQKLHQEFGLKYIKAYAVEYARLRSVPVALLQVIPIIANLDRISKLEGSFPDNLKVALDASVTRLEQTGGLEVFANLDRQVSGLESTVGQIVDGEPDSIPGLQARINILRANLANGRTDATPANLDSLSAKLVEAQSQLKTLGQLLWIGWIFVVVFVFAGFLSRRKPSVNSKNRKLV